MRKQWYTLYYYGEPVDSCLATDLEDAENQFETEWDFSDGDGNFNIEAD
jgi:hypothetical protein